MLGLLGTCLSSQVDNTTRVEGLEEVREVQTFILVALPSEM